MNHRSNIRKTICLLGRIEGTCLKTEFIDEGILSDGGGNEALVKAYYFLSTRVLVWMRVAGTLPLDTPDNPKQRAAHVNLKVKFLNIV